MDLKNNITKEEILNAVYKLPDIMCQEDVDNLLEYIKELKERKAKTNLDNVYVYLLDTDNIEKIMVKLKDVLQEYRKEIREILGIEKSLADTILKPLRNK